MKLTIRFSEMISSSLRSGRVWLQSMPVRKLVRALAPFGRNRGKESGSILGSFLKG